MTTKTQNRYQPTPVIDPDFEALWQQAINFDPATFDSVDSVPQDQILDELLPQNLLNSIKRVADRALEQGLIDQEQHAIVEQCHQQQLALFNTINTTQLRNLILTLQFNQEG
ncbi:MAG: hypothetical protein KTR32_39355 [Granulosicoccus sp.]|nr:hypothetical protein [Granulosicoccus sp.]